MTRGAHGRYKAIEPEELRIIGPGEWSYQRWGWLESIRRDTGLSTQARLIAHVLALDFTNGSTVRCDPSLRQIAAVTGVSEDTAKRAIRDLCEGGWVVRDTGRGRGKCSGYGFVTRAKIVHLKRSGDEEKGAAVHPFEGSEKGAKLHPQKGAGMHPYQGSEKGAKLPGKGGKTASRHNIAKPWKNHEGAREASDEGKTLTDPLEAAADFYASKIKAGRYIPPSAVSPTIARLMVSKFDVTEEELREVGMGNLL